LIVKRQETADRFSDLFQEFLNEEDGGASERLLERIVCQLANPLIEEIVGFKLRTNPAPGFHRSELQDAEDVRADIAMRLIKRLRLVKSTGQGSTISNLRGYIAIMAYNACDLYFRRRYPRRHSLRSKLRYILNHQRGLALWERDVKRWVCGFESWRKAGVRTTGPVEPVREDILHVLSKKFADGGRSQPGDLLASIFDWTGGPADFDEVVELVADLWDVRDLPLEVLNDERTELAAVESFDWTETIDSAIDQRVNIARLWAEIGLLPPRQRAALLLHSRDNQGTSVIVLLPRIGIATIRTIAATLEMTAEELASLWNDLPLDDTRIADKLDVTRQQVINLRKSARQRLARRMAASNRS
jgi:hypothetical protein